MSQRHQSQRQPHHDPDLFREAIRFTAERTGYQSRLIEKDFFSTLLLDYLAATDASLVFKGGTCLAKVHAGFYRLIEDLDFSIPISHKNTRTERRRAAQKLKTALALLPDQVPVFQIKQRCLGANNSTAYVAVVGYRSVLGESEDTIKIEIGMREPLLMPAIVGAAQTLLLDPISEQSLLGSVMVNCLSKLEAYSEKFRAALSRREPAIRDFFDLEHAVRLLSLPTDDPQLIDLIRRKLSVPGNDEVDVSESRLLVLRGQLATQLRPVLRSTEFRQFDLDRAFALVKGMAEMVK